MTKSGSKYMKIKISTETGEVVKVTDENNNKATELTPTELQQIYETHAPKHIGTILHVHSSPWCIVLRLGGLVYKICW